MRRLALFPLTLAGSIATAETPAPDYYVEALFAVTTAETLVQFCPEVGLNTDATTAEAEAVLNRLTADGIGGEAILGLTGIEAGVEILQAAFVARHGLEDPSEATLCAAAQAEMTEGSAIGRILVEKEDQS